MIRLFLFILASMFFAACTGSGGSSSPTSSESELTTPDPQPTPTPGPGATPRPTPTPSPTPRPTPTPNPTPTPDPEEFPPIPQTSLDAEGVGTKSRVSGLFDRWTLKSSVTGGRGSQYADVTTECHGLIELNLALTAQQWQDSAQKSAYYRNIEKEIVKAGEQLLLDHGSPLSGTEKQDFLRALKALAWQETRWQHYMRYKDWFFVIVSGGSYNALDDWGITQVARSGFDARDFLNVDFFQDKDHCSLTDSLSYGFQEYYDAYMDARSLSCNAGDSMRKIQGAYNRYSSGYSSCYNGYSSDPDYRDYQTAAMTGIKTHFEGQPWLQLQ